ncbi:MAG: hypothetical protein ABIP12_07050 [Terriglobales bacterium]
MENLVAVGNLHIRAEVIPFRWKCSGCAEVFTVKHFPLTADDPQYMTEVAVVEYDFAAHCKTAHRLLVMAATA